MSESTTSGSRSWSKADELVAEQVLVLDHQ